MAGGGGGRMAPQKSEGAIDVSLASFGSVLSSFSFPMPGPSYVRFGASPCSGHEGEVRGGFRLGVYGLIVHACYSSCSSFYSSFCFMTVGS